MSNDHRAQTGLGPLDVTTSDGGFRCVHERGCEPAVYKRYRVGPAAIKTWTLYGANDSAIAFARDLDAARADNEAMRKLLGTCREALEKIVAESGEAFAHFLQCQGMPRPLPPAGERRREGGAGVSIFIDWLRSTADHIMDEREAGKFGEHQKSGSCPYCRAEGVAKDLTRLADELSHAEDTTTKETQT